MIRLHHLEHSRSHRVLWLLEELEVPYELVTYKRDPETQQAPETLLKIHPLGKSPVITDDDRTVAESGAIIEYLVERHGNGRLAPDPGTPEHLRYRYFLHYAEGSLMPPLLVKFLMDRVRSAPLPFLVRPVAKTIANRLDERYTTPNLQRHARFLHDELGDTPWLTGDTFTAADIQMSYPVEVLAHRAGVPLTARLRSYLDRIRDRPAYARAIKAGGSVLME